LAVEWEVPDPSGLGDVMIPPLSIQPLVENAIKHGIEPARAGGVVSISLQRTPRAVVITVSNPAPPDEATSAGHGIGLSAVRSRIEVFTLGQGGVSTAVEDGRYVARLSLPTP